MTLNPYFNNYAYTEEQNLLRDLSTEMIQIYGLELYYIRREHVQIDELFLEDPLSKFETARLIEMYIKDYMGYGMMSDIMSKFGPMMNDTLTLCVMKHRFLTVFPEMIRPFAGDLIYVPMTKSLFEVKYVEHEDNFYQHGTLLYFDLKVERFNYSSERLDTGVSSIDAIESEYSFATSELDTFETEDGEIMELESGVELNTEQIFGVTANTTPADPFSSPDTQNEYIEDESQVIMDFSESNPFGKLS